jgi:hypothetical protein
VIFSKGRELTGAQVYLATEKDHEVNDESFVDTEAPDWLFIGVAMELCLVVGNMVGLCGWLMSVTLHLLPKLKSLSRAHVAVVPC